MFQTRVTSVSECKTERLIGWTTWQLARACRVARQHARFNFCACFVLRDVALTEFCFSSHSDMTSLETRACGVLKHGTAELQVVIH